MVKMSIPVDRSVKRCNLPFDFNLALAGIQEQTYIGLCGNQVIYELDFIIPEAGNDGTWRRQ